MRDPLTGLHNRRHVDSRLAELLAEVERHGTPLTLALIDLDHFKRVNDTRSHAVGDEVLRVVAGILDAAAGSVEGGLAARIGGEEFLLVLPGVDQPRGCERLERLRRRHRRTRVDRRSPTGSSSRAASGRRRAHRRVERSALLSLADQYLYPPSARVATASSASADDAAGPVRTSGPARAPRRRPRLTR